MTKITGADRTRRGFLLPLSLLLLLIVSVSVMATQWSAHHTASAVKRETLAVDSFHRAWGVINMMISRLKPRVGGKTMLEDHPAEGTEEGVWEGRRFVMGWTLGRVPPRPREARFVVWIRFPGDRPVLTHRFDLLLRTAVMMDPGAVVVQGYTIDEVDPTSATSREQGMKQRGPGPGDPGTDALVELFDCRITASQTAGQDPDEMWKSLTPDAVLGALPAMRECLAEYESSRAAPSPAKAVEAARRSMTAAASLPEPLRAAWDSGCRYRLASEIDRLAGARSGEPRMALLEEAEELLAPVVDQDPESCGAPRATWLWARIAMRRRPDPASKVTLITARARAVEKLRLMADKHPEAAIHRRTDIRRVELPGMFESVWRARLGIEISGGQRVVATVREDGAGVLALADLPSSSAFYEVSAWMSDGSGLLVRGDREFWHVAADGSGMEEIRLEEVESCDGRPRPRTDGYRLGPAIWDERRGGHEAGFIVSNGILDGDGYSLPSVLFLFRDQCLLANLPIVTSEVQFPVFYGRESAVYLEAPTAARPTRLTRVDHRTGLTTFRDLPEVPWPVPITAGERFGSGATWSGSELFIWPDYAAGAQNPVLHFAGLDPSRPPRRVPLPPGKSFYGVEPVITTGELLIIRQDSLDLLRWTESGDAVMKPVLLDSELWGTSMTSSPFSPLAAYIGRDQTLRGIILDLATGSRRRIGGDGSPLTLGGWYVPFSPVPEEGSP